MNLAGVASHKAYSEPMFDNKHLQLFSSHTGDAKQQKKIKMAKTDKQREASKSIKWNIHCKSSFDYYFDDFIMAALYD